MKTKFIFSFLFFICCIANLIGQSNWIWEKRGGTLPGFGSYACATCSDANGNVFITGGFASPTITFGSIILSNSHPTGDTLDFFIAKYDSTGNLLWAKSAGGTSYDFGYSLSTDSIGNVFVTGTFNSPQIIFGTDTLLNFSQFINSSDFFIAKYDANGNVLWARSFAGDGDDNSKSICIDKFGNVFVTGFFESDSISLGNTTLFNANGGWNVFIAKFDASGNVIWAKSAGASSDGQALSVTSSPAGNVFITGFFTSPTIIFGSNILTNLGWSNIFIVSYDPNGNVLWAQSAGGTQGDKAYSISADSHGNLFLTGSFSSSTLAFGNISLTNAGLTDVFVAKYDSNGNVLWAKSSGGTDDEGGYCVSTDTSGNSFVTGFFLSYPLSFGLFALNYPIGLIGNIIPMFIVKYDSFGNVICASALASNGGDFQGVCGDHYGNAYVCGDFSSNPFIVGNDSLIPSGTKDIFVAKFKASCDFDAVKEFSQSQNIPIFPNPSNGKFTIEIQTNESSSNLEIYNSLGEKIISQKLQSEKTEIDLSDQPNGIYFVNVQTETESFTKKIIIEK